MKTKDVDVSYRDKEQSKDVSLGKIEVQIPESVEEAVELYGVEDLLDFASKAYIIDKQREFRDANRPDRPKTQSNTAKFKALSAEKQEELLKQAGII